MHSLELVPGHRDRMYSTHLITVNLSGNDMARQGISLDHDKSILSPVKQQHGISIT